MVFTLRQPITLSGNKKLDKLDLERGLHSNIPLCCIEFFNRGWFPLKAAEILYGFVDPFIKDYEAKLPSWGYVPCPDCLKTGNRAEIHWCDETCPVEMQEERGPVSI